MENEQQGLVNCLSGPNDSFLVWIVLVAMSTIFFLTNLFPSSLLDHAAAFYHIFAFLYWRSYADFISYISAVNRVHRSLSCNVIVSVHLLHLNHSYFYP